jgi:4-hydroxybenzoate polyprenyltransferase/phosphoserine phosphatase
MLNCKSSATSAPSPLFVDLDGTLIASDLLVEAMVVLLARQSRALLRVPGWLLCGRARLKQGLAECVTPNVKLLPFRQNVLTFLTAQKQAGRRLVLATASNQRWAQAVADSLGLFDDILASDGSRNLKGAKKLEAIEAYCREHGAQEFGYIGDATADLPIWRAASEVYAIEPSRSILGQLGETHRPFEVLEERRSKWKAVVRAIRPHQWIKNILIFVPLVAGHKLADFTSVLGALTAFVAFCLFASAVYVLNDVLDIEADRAHPEKCRRPFASGALPIIWSAPLIIVLLALGFGLSVAFLPWTFLALLALYLVVTTLYSLWLKRKVLVDVFVLAGLYTIRIVAGGDASGIEVSEWLLAFSMFMFTSLAFAKRYTELLRLESQPNTRIERRGYVASDVSLIESVGPASGYMSVLILALYLHSPEVKLLYSQPRVLWLICPVIMYWISRMWFQSKRRNLKNDPVVFAVTDRYSWLAAAITALLLVIGR